MTIPETDAHRQLRVMDYLYGELEPAERHRFEQDLESDPTLRQIFEAEKRLDGALPPGSQPRIDAERLQGTRWVIRQRLQQATRPRFSLSRWFESLRARPLAVTLQGAAMAFTFFLGVLVAAPGAGVRDGAPAAVTRQVAASPLDLINENDFEIYQLRVNDYDAATGEIDLSFSLASDTRLSGNVADETIHQLMAVALQDDIDSAARLDTINALHNVRTGDQVNDALIHVLMNDENPGVRYQAVRSLVDLADQERVREALRGALREDVNQGVRIEAFNALMDYQDEATLDLFRQQMDSDSSEYIRAQARSVVEAASGPDDQIF
ncbi:MAG: HEAT repeat domain-containing protein [Pseudohongiellaceae bacterium]